MWSSIGNEKQNNPALQFDAVICFTFLTVLPSVLFCYCSIQKVEPFVKYLTTDQPQAPQYFFHDVELNLVRFFIQTHLVLQSHSLILCYCMLTILRYCCCIGRGSISVRNCGEMQVDETVRTAQHFEIRHDCLRCRHSFCEIELAFVFYFNLIVNLYVRKRNTITLILASRCCFLWEVKVAQR